MFIVDSYPLAIVLCLVTMLCWGSWANTQKLASKEWPFQLFYWDYSIGVLLLSLGLAFTLGSSGGEGRGFLADLAQADWFWIGSALLGGITFNLSNILFVAAIYVAGLAVAFPVGIGLALVLGVVTTYHVRPEGNVPLLVIGVACIVIAIVIDALAYKRLPHSGKASAKGLILSLLAGLLMGWFYSFVANSMAALSPDTRLLEGGKLTPYTALVFFSLGVFLSNFLWNSVAMRWPFSGARVSYRDYFCKGNLRLHLIGILGGLIWNLGMGLNILASSSAGPALSYGLGQGATMIGALWGVFVWKEFRTAPPGTSKLLAAMFFFYLVGLGILIVSKL